MDLSYGAAAEEFRKEVRVFLAGQWQPGERRGSELREFVRAFRRQAIEAGYLYRAIPKRYGGSEQPVDVIRAQVIREDWPRPTGPVLFKSCGWAGWDLAAARLALRAAG